MRTPSLFDPQEQAQILRQKEQRLSELRNTLIDLSYYQDDISNEEIAYSEPRVTVNRDGTDYDDIHDAHFEFRRLFVDLHGSPEIKEQVRKVDAAYKTFSDLRNAVVGSREMTDSLLDELKANQSVLTARDKWYAESFVMLDLMQSARHENSNSMRASH